MWILFSSSISHFSLFKVFYGSQNLLFNFRLWQVLTFCFCEMFGVKFQYSKIWLIANHWVGNILISGNLGSSLHVSLAGWFIVLWLNHFKPMLHFCTSWKRQKTFDFRRFSGGIEMELASKPMFSFFSMFSNIMRIL